MNGLNTSSTLDSAPPGQGTITATAPGRPHIDLKKKVVCTGDGGIGKTALLITYAENRFPEQYVPTVFENYVPIIRYEGKTIELALWDTAGQEEYDRLRPLSYPETDVMLIGFAVDYPVSLANVQDKWFPEVNHFCEGVPIILVGLKIDLRTDEKAIKLLACQGTKPVSTEQGEAVAKQIGAAAYVECSARQRQGVQEVFDTALREACRKRWTKHRVAKKCLIL